ncbi:hypothetical protein Desdi_2805 [Desulfitobacterium dichloroeliminans LMG P-21439]|uniref:Uncharacterized protein n=1 Tax=Desulfitobacterium dichloroeliminans (strain LMG P-21439 / DCA1) TaxID=871963 RepID=L0FAH0_DESDL|nr:hypothetical protein [Desulfitobacterium dichloroeliminans]AGA70217.1 hypothetical protein Desdi_2805 [Desulfitobacterium dichloroeliminans LMG P-21439]
MWPKQKILLLVPRGFEGWQGILSLLNALHRNVIVRETSAETPMDLADFSSSGLEEESYRLADVGPTEILYWPGIPPEDPYREWGLSRGLMQTVLTEFLHRYWAEEILLPVSHTESEEEPFLWRILNKAGFEPSLLWQKEEGQWDVRIGNGLHWVISAEWLQNCLGGEAFGRRPQSVLPESCWIRRENRVEFYGDQKHYEYLGCILPSEDNAKEDIIYSIVLQALRIGVPWDTIRRIQDVNLNIFLGIDPRENIRWYADDFAWGITRNEGTGRTPISSEKPEYMANRGIG